MSASYHRLYPLLQHLDATRPAAPSIWRAWRIEPVGGGRNNLLYRAHGELGDFAVKFTIRDDRDRAGSEYWALLVLQHAGLDLAPRPVLLEQTRYRQPVVVQTWVDGEIVGVAPTSESDWRALVQHYAAVHHVTPANTDAELGPAVLTMDSATAGRGRIAKETAHVPPSDWPEELRRLIDSLDRATFPDWPAPPVTLCRGDSNPQNFLRRPTGLASVDWEYSGWGDPAFELAELRCHPAYLAVSAPSIDDLVTMYAPLDGDPTFTIRAHTYYRLMLVWWAARFARILYEVDRGLDERLVPRPSTWRAETMSNYDEYVRRAELL
jgi:aminoglycoside phosphotransferase (APT) family kinase protein